jgi:hypothetical protein
VSSPSQAATGADTSRTADTRSQVTRIGRRGSRSTSVPAGIPTSTQGSQTAAASSPTWKALACSVVTATSGAATWVVAVPSQLTV